MKLQIEDKEEEVTVFVFVFYGFVVGFYYGMIN